MQIHITKSKKTTQLKNLILSNKLEFFLESHNAVCSKIVEEAGFPAIWGSGLTLSASLGVRDNNELTWTQVLDQLEFMNDACSIPILVDGDNGFGNFNNTQRFVKKLEARGLAGICIEDKIFPKTNSFINSSQQSLVSIPEFAGKIKAVKDIQKDPDFCVVARTEAFITGNSLNEVLKRAEAYYKAGADALVIHSKLTDVSQIKSFMDVWDFPCPIIVIPTTYYKTPAFIFESLGISTVIFANHMLRAAIQTMKKVAQDINAYKSTAQLEEEIISLKEIFRLQKDEELRIAEKIYLPAA